MNTKTLLQICRQSPNSKQHYRVKKNSFQLLKTDPPVEYPFDNICYSSHDINTSIIYDLILDYSQKCKMDAMIQSTTSLNMLEEAIVNADILEQSNSSFFSSTNNNIKDNCKYKEPDAKYTVIFDQMINGEGVKDFIKQISTAQIFKRQTINIGHFQIHQNGIYDFHKLRLKISHTERAELEQENKSKDKGSIQDNFMWIYNKQINLCDEIKPNAIKYLPHTISYISAEQFCSYADPTQGVRIGQTLTKAQQMRNKQLSLKKVLQVYVINISNKLRVNLIIFNYNKSYNITPQAQKQLDQFLMMWGVVTGDIKFQNTKVEMMNHFMKGIQRLYYVMYFPGPRITFCPILPNKNVLNCKLNRQSIEQNASMINSKNMSQNKNQRKTACYTAVSTPATSQLRINKMTSISYATPVLLKNASMLVNSSQMMASKTSQHWKPPNVVYQEQINMLFHNYQSLRNQDNGGMQKIIQDYLVKKQQNLKLELDKLKERVKDLKATHKVDVMDVADMKIKCTKALEKMSTSIIQLQKMGIKNVERHMDWLKLIIDEKKLQIKQQQEGIEDIRFKILEGKKNHQYFHAKLNEFRDKLQNKQLQMLKKDLKHPERLQQLESALSNKQNNQKQKFELTDLSPKQLQQLQRHKQNLKSKLIQKLKKSAQKKSFIDVLNQVRTKLTKIQTSKIEQRYFDLFNE